MKIIEWIKRLFTWLFGGVDEKVTVKKIEPETLYKGRPSVQEPKTVFIATGHEYHPRRKKFKGYNREARHCSFNKRRSPK